MATPLPLRISLISLAFTAAVACVLTALGGYFLYAQQSEGAQTRARLAAEELAARAERLAALQLRLQDVADFHEQCEAVISNDPLLSEAVVFDALGVALHRYSRGQARMTQLPLDSLLPFESQSDSSAGGRLALVVIHDPVRQAAGALGYAVVGVDERAVVQETLGKLAWLVVIALLLLALGLGVQHVVFWRAVGRPLALLVTTADEIQPDRLDTTPLVLDKAAEDDIGKVYAALARLIERLQDARFALMEQNALLESTVRLRTSELEQANAALAHDIERRKHLEEELRTLANTDALTGLANRAFALPYLQQRLAQVQREKRSLGLVLMDYDGFKMINDTWGHAVGDQVLQIMARRMQQVCRQSDVLARLGGDEFLVIFEEFADEAAAIGFCERIAAQFEAPVQAGDRSLTLGISIGLALFPQHGSTVDALFAAADQAMYAIKQNGGGVAVAQS